MDKEVFNEIIEGLKEMVAIEKGEIIPDPSRVHVFCIPDTKLIRSKTGLSQSKFAKKFGINKKSDNFAEIADIGRRMEAYIIANDYQQEINVWHELEYCKYLLKQQGYNE